MADLLNISLRSNIKQEIKKLSAEMYKQVNFATAKALTQLAKEVQQDEIENITKTFKHPKPFTKNAVGMRGARKDTLTAVVFVKPIAAKYLQPYEDGGAHKLPGRVLFNPKDIKLDKYGQLPRNILAKLRARPDIYIGKIKTKGGMVNGVWQRIPAKKATTNRRTKVHNPAQAAHLKLLIRFGDALPVNKHLNYRSRAKALIDRRFKSVFDKCMADALATAR